MATTSTDSNFTSDYSMVNGIKMYYEIHGSGQPLVLLHGGGSTINITFGRMIPLLAQKHQIIAMDLQAHGKTADRNQPSSFEQDADDVAALLQNLNVKKADFFGFSNGGSSVMQIGIRHPQLVNKLIIASAFYKKSGMMAGFFEGMQHATIDMMPPQVKDAYLAEVNDQELLQLMFDRDSQRMKDFTDWPDSALQSIKSNTLILMGDQDVMTTEHGVEMSRMIPDARLAILPGGHGDYLGDVTTLNNGQWKQQWVVELIEDFLAS